MIARLQSNRVRRTYLGGGRIDAFTDAVADCGDGVSRPEDWLASTVTAFNGTMETKGEGLGRLDDGRLVRDVVGDLPFLVKLLDGDERLVIQAHPTVPCANRLFSSLVGKTECWYFLSGTAADACVYLWFKPGVTRAKWCAAFEAQHGLLDMLHRIPVAPGDFVFVNGGVPHAIGGGCFMIELQEPSDLMVVAERITPSGRRIPDAKMHGGVGWKRMFDVYEYETFEYEDVCRRYVKRCFGQEEKEDVKVRALRTSCEKFCICGPDLTDKFSMWCIERQGHLNLSHPACAVVTDGVGEVNGVTVRKGDRLLVTDERFLETNGSAKIVICTSNDWWGDAAQRSVLPEL